MRVTIDEVIAWVPEWRGKTVVVQRLPNGLTNLSYRVDVDGTAFAIRIPGESTELLGVDRLSELHNARIAARLGVGPRVTHHFPESGVAVTEFIHGRRLTADDLRAPGMPARIARSLRRLHGGPRFRNDFGALRLAHTYLTAIDARGLPAPAGLRGRLATIRRLETALDAHAPATVPCHNDLLPDNYIDDGQSLRFVDYEYSGNGDPAFDLGNTCRELDYDDARVEALCGAYFGAVSRRRLARVMLHMIVSDVTWALWAVIQAAVSRLEFDFRGYGLARWARAEAAMDASPFARRLEAVQAPSRSP